VFSFDEIVRGWCEAPPWLSRRAGRGRKRRDEQVAAVLRGQPLEGRAVMALSAAVAVVYDQMVADAMYHADLAPAQVPELLELLQPSGRFSDLKYNHRSDSGAVEYMTHLDRVKVLTQAYRYDSPLNSFFQDEALRAEIVASWKFMAAAPSVQNPNWWHGRLGVPRQMAPALLLGRDLLPARTVSSLLQKHVSSKGTWSKPGVAANLLDQATAAFTEGVLRNDPARLRSVVSRTTSEIMKTTGEALAVDMSFRQHGAQWYSGTYGYNYLTSAAKLIRWVDGTEFEYSEKPVGRIVGFLLDHCQWLLRGDLMEIGVQGRSIARPGSPSARGRLFRDEAEKLLAIGVRAEELAKMVERFDFGVTSENALVGNIGLWRSDGMMHQRQDWMAGLRLTSSRNQEPENLLGENRRNQNMGGGMLTLLADGDEYGVGPEEIFPVWDWKHIPGTTAEQSPGLGQIARSTSTFVGTASDGLYGFSAMDFRRSSLNVSARKAWFFFDDEVVALGSDIRGTSLVNPVHTTFNQSVLRGDVTIRGGDDVVSTVPLESGVTVADPRWVHHDGFGYVPLGPSDPITVQALTQTGDWSQIGTRKGPASVPVFSAWVDHGVNPQVKTYAYAVVGGVEAAELDDYVAASAVEVIANTAELQAVRHRELGIIQAVFYRPGQLEVAPGVVLSVKQAGLVMLRETADGWDVTVSDPTHLRKQIELQLPGRYGTAGAKWDRAAQVTRIAIALPAGQEAGKSVTRSVAPLVGEAQLLSASADALLRGGTQATKNFGSLTTLGVHNNYNATNQRESLLRFDLSGVTGRVLSAQVVLVPLSAGTGVRVAVAATADDLWNESTATYKTKPLSLAELDRQPVAAGQPLVLDVTAAAQEAAGGDQVLSLRLWSVSTKSAKGAALFGSREGAPEFAPVLEIFVAPPETTST
jgi:chondroitin AC lyase